MKEEIKQRIIYINALAPDGGDGSKEHPLNRIPKLENLSYITVQGTEWPHPSLPIEGDK